MPRANFIVQRKYSVDVSWSTSLRASYVRTRTHDPISIRRTVRTNEVERARNCTYDRGRSFYDRLCLRSLVLMVLTIARACDRSLGSCLRLTICSSCLRSLVLN